MVDRRKICEKCVPRMADHRYHYCQARFYELQDGGMDPNNAADLSNIESANFKTPESCPFTLEHTLLQEQPE